MPFSRSRSPESMTRSATLSAWCAVKAPAWRSIASTSVVLPWSTWATIATLRRSVRAVRFESEEADMAVRRHFRWVRGPDRAAASLPARVLAADSAASVWTAGIPTGVPPWGRELVCIP